MDDLPSQEKVCALFTLEDVGYNIQLSYLYFKNYNVCIPDINNKNAQHVNQDFPTLLLNT